MTRDETKERDKNRPIIVHCIALLIQHATVCDDDDAVHAAWNVFAYMGEPRNLPPSTNGHACPTCGARITAIDTLPCGTSACPINDGQSPHEVSNET